MMTPSHMHTETVAMIFAAAGASNVSRSAIATVRRDQIEHRRVDAGDGHEQQLELERRVVDVLDPVRPSGTSNRSPD